jgi:hypothetical protein
MRSRQLRRVFVHKSVHNTLCRLTGPRELVRGSTNSGQAIFGVPPGTNPLSLILGDATTDSAGYPAILQALVGAAGNNPALIALAYLVGGVAIVYDLTTEVLQFLVTFPLLAAPLLAIPASGHAAGVQACL